MAEPTIPGGQRRPGLVEYALIIALVAVLVIGVLIVLQPAISKLLDTLIHA